MKRLALFALAIALLPARSHAVEPAGDGTGKWEKRSSFLRSRIFHSAVWTYAEMIVWGGGANHEFYNDGAAYDPATDKWRMLSAVNAPSARWGHAAVWTGTEMIIWGGRSSFAASDHKNDGALYNPSTNTWRPITTTGAPSGRSQMAAVWTGQELLVWGGIGDGGDCPQTGGRYDPATDSWAPLELKDAPEGRTEPAFTWTGAEMIVWGGLLPGGKKASGTGGRYDPEKKLWKPLPLKNAPEPARGLHAVWTGSEMLVWGGSHLEGEGPVNVGTNTGGRYHPATDSWQPMETRNAPDGRMYHAAVWTGDELLIWGGGDQTDGLKTTGARYDSGRNQWRALPLEKAPSGRSIMTSVWTGEGMLIFGGSTGGSDAFNELHYFRPRGPAED